MKNPFNLGIALLTITVLCCSSLQGAQFKIGLVVSDDAQASEIKRDIYDGAALAVSEGSGNHTIALAVPNFEKSIRQKLIRLNSEPSLSSAIVFATPNERESFSKALNEVSYPILCAGISLQNHQNGTRYFQLSPDAKLQAEAMIRHAMQAKAAQSIGVIILDNGEHSLTMEISEVFQQYNLPVPFIPLKERVKDTRLFRMKPRTATRLKKIKPSALFLFGNSEDVVHTAMDLREMNLSCPLYLRMRNATRTVLNRVYNLGEIYCVTAASHRNDIPGEPGFVDRFANRFGRDPSSWASLAYDGVMEIIKASNSGDPAMNLANLPLGFGTGFALDFSRQTRWYPAISKLEGGNLRVQSLPGKSQLSSTPLNRVTPSSLPQNIQQRDAFRRQPSYNSYAPPQNDITQSGTVRKWRHFLVLPD